MLYTRIHSETIVVIKHQLLTKLYHSIYQILTIAFRAKIQKLIDNNILKLDTVGNTLVR